MDLIASLAKGLQRSWPLRTAQCQECIQEERGCRSKKEHLILNVLGGREGRVDMFVFHNQQRGHFLTGCPKARGTGLPSQSLPAMRKTSYISYRTHWYKLYCQCHVECVLSLLTVIPIEMIFFGPGPIPVPALIIVRASFCRRCHFLTTARWIVHSKSHYIPTLQASLCDWHQPKLMTARCHRELQTLFWNIIGGRNYILLTNQWCKLFVHLFAMPHICCAYLK